MAGQDTVTESNNRGTRSKKQLIYTQAISEAKPQTMTDTVQ